MSRKYLLTSTRIIGILLILACADWREEVALTFDCMCFHIAHSRKIDVWNMVWTTARFCVKWTFIQRIQRLELV